jgi:hypothetical protein
MRKLGKNTNPTPLPGLPVGLTINIISRDLQKFKQLPLPQDFIAYLPHRLSTIPVLEVSKTSEVCHLYRLVIGSRRSLPKARGVILTPGGAWRRLYSLRSTMPMTRRTVASPKPRATISSTPRSSST